MSGPNDPWEDDEDITLEDILEDECYDDPEPPEYDPEDEMMTQIFGDSYSEEGYFDA